jgi:L-ascorbate metabolism protein UlaG (beta-lactamase superfamily)
VLVAVGTATGAACQDEPSRAAVAPRPGGERVVPASAADPLALRYVANAGVLLTTGGVRFLIDAPVREGIPPYATGSRDERERLERAQPPYDRVDAILVTHWHEDHFSAGAVAAHLSSNARAVLVSSPEVVERVLAVNGSLGSRVRPVLPEPGASQAIQVGGVTVRVLRLRHNPTRRLPEQHVGFLVGEAGAVLHTGDADPTRENFALLRGLPAVDLALVPFWFLQPAGSRDLVRTSIAPRRAAALHLPPDDAARVRESLAGLSMPTVLLTTPGTDVVLPLPAVRPVG